MNASDTFFEYGFKEQSEIAHLSESMLRYMNNDYADTYKKLSDKVYALVNDESVDLGNALNQMTLLEDELSSLKLKFLKDCQMLTGLAMLNSNYKSGIDNTLNSLRVMSKNLNSTGLNNRIRDLELSMSVSDQIAAQISLLLNNNNQLAEQIQNTLLTTLTLWKTRKMLTN